MLAVGITFTVIFGITAVSCLGAAGLFTPNAAVLQALLQDSFMAENAAAMGSFALGAVRITGWCFAAVTAVFVWMITAGASRLKASKTLLRLAEAAEGFDCKKGLPLEAVDEKKARALKRVRRFIRNGWLSAWVDEKAEKLYLTAEDYRAAQEAAAASKAPPQPEPATEKQTMCRSILRQRAALPPCCSRKTADAGCAGPRRAGPYADHHHCHL